jgi:phage tail sheath protein FI
MPTIWLASYYTQVTGVITTLASWAANYGGVYFLDEVAGATVANAVTHRGGGSGSKLDTNDERCIIVYPQVYVLDPGTNTEELRPLSMFAAGYMSKIDRLFGPQRSLSNVFTGGGTPVPLLGIEGVELDLTWHPNTAYTTDVSTLDGVEVVTLRRGNLFWGNRSAAYRDSSAVNTFYSVRRVADLIKVAIVDGSVQFVDRPINKLLIDTILQTGNAYLSGLVQAGTIVDGRMTYNIADNPSDQIALGILTFGFYIIPQIPAENIVYEFNITVEGLAEILAA